MALAPQTNTHVEGTGEERTPIEPTGLSLLASDVFGQDFKGEVRTQDADVSGDEDTNVATMPEGEEAEGTGDAEPDSEAEETGEEEVPGEGEEQGTEEGEDEGEPITSLEQLAEQNQWDREWLDGLEVPVKIDGKTANVTLKQLVTNHQIGEAAEKRLSTAKERVQSLYQGIEQREGQLQTQLAVAAEMIQKAEDLIDSDAESINWPELRESDPAEYAAKKAEIEERRKSFGQFKIDAAAKYQEAVRQEQESVAGKRLQFLQSENEALLKALPEWKTEETALAEKTRLSEYLLDQGFSQNDVANAADHRLIVVARKAMLWDEMKAKEPAAKKKVTRVPVVMKPGTLKSGENISREKVAQARARAQKSGTVDDAFALLKVRREG